MQYAGEMIQPSRTDPTAWEIRQMSWLLLFLSLHCCLVAFSKWLLWQQCWTPGRHFLVSTLGRHCWHKKNKKRWATYLSGGRWLIRENYRERRPGIAYSTFTAYYPKPGRITTRWSPRNSWTFATETVNNVPFISSFINKSTFIHKTTFTKTTWIMSAKC